MLLQLENQLQRENQDSQSSFSFETKKFWLKKAGLKMPVAKGFQSSVGHQLFQRFHSFKQPEPGPGSYDPFVKYVQRELQRNRKIPPLGGSVKRSFLNQSSILPGPGSYQLSTQNEPKRNQRLVLKSFSKQSVKTLDEVPGPGYYSNQGSGISPENRYRHIFMLPSQKINRQKKQTELQRMIEEFRVQQQVQQAPLLKKSKKVNKNRTDKVYLPRYLISTQQSDVGPGSYNISLPDMRPHYMQFKNSANFMYADKPIDLIQNVPGPGYYQTNELGKRGISYKFIKSQKNSELKKQKLKEIEPHKLKQTQVVMPKEKRSFLYNLHSKWV